MAKAMTVRKVAKHAQPNRNPHNPANRYRLWSISAIYRRLARAGFKEREEVVRILRTADGAER